MEYYEEEEFEERDWDEELESDSIDPAERGLIEGYERTAEKDDSGSRKEEERESFEFVDEDAADLD